MSGFDTAEMVNLASWFDKKGWVTSGDVIRRAIAHIADLETTMEARTPCEVRLPPTTIYKAGVSLATLISGLRVRGFNGAKVQVPVTEFAESKAAKVEAAMTRDENEAFEAMRNVLLTQRKMVAESKGRLFGLRRLGRALISNHQDWQGYAHMAIEMAERARPAPPYRPWRSFQT